MLDDIDIKPTEFYERLKFAKEMPTTSQPSAGEFFDFFTKISKTADSIVGIFISDELSGTIDSAVTAAGMMEGYPIEIVDSRSTSMGLGFMVLEAIRAREAGLSQIEIAQAARALIPKMRVLFVVDTLEFLHRGGRIGGAVRFPGPGEPPQCPGRPGSDLAGAPGRLGSHCPWAEGVRFRSWLCCSLVTGPHPCATWSRPRWNRSLTCSSSRV